MKILLIEDDPSLKEIIESSLIKERYKVESVSSSNAAIMKIEDYTYDCILLDIMLPDGSGLDILRYLKSNSIIANVVIISAKDAIEDKVLGLDLGADDYLSKPFHLVELHARIKSVIRRSQNNGSITIQLANVKLMPDRFEVYVNNNLLELNRKEYDILHYFINRPERLINKEILVESVWGDHISQINNYDFMYSQIKNLRKKLKEADSRIEIKAIYGFGYKLVSQE